jgi:hypothetical protein
VTVLAVPTNRRFTLKVYTDVCDGVGSANKQTFYTESVY